MSDAPGRVPPLLMPCPGCRQFVRPRTKVCPHCDGSIARMTAALRVRRRNEKQAVERVQAILQRLDKLSDSFADDPCHRG